MYKQYKNRDSKSKKILSFIGNSARTTAEILEDILGSHPDRHKVTKNLLGYMKEPKFDYEKWKQEEEQKLYALISKLRRDGLLKKNKAEGKILWESTKSGLKKLKSLAQANILPIKLYKKKETKDLTLIIFDVPEKFKKKREWLRLQLIELGFDILQKSVWIGKCQIPEEFVHDLKVMNILSYIHIFKVSKKGSMAGEYLAGSRI